MWSKRARVTVGILLSIVVGAAGWVVWNHEGNGVQHVVSDAIDTTHVSEQMTASAIAGGGLSTSHPESIIKDARTALERSDDLFSFVQEQALNAGTGDSDAMWLIAKAMDYCSAYALNPVGFASDTEILLSQIPRDAAYQLKSNRDRVSRRCKGFAGPNTDKQSFQPSGLIAGKRLAAKNGSLAAEAALLALRSPLSTENDYLMDLVRRVSLSKDPEAYLAISDSMGVSASGHEKIFGPISGTEDATYAWQLAACRQGLDCSSTGTLMSMYCLNGGICGPYGNFESLVFSGLVPASSKDRIDAMVNQIISLTD